MYGTLGKSLVGTQYAIRYTFIIYLRFGISIVELKIRFIIILLKLYTACAATVRASRQAHRQGLGRARATRPTLHLVAQRYTEDTYITSAHRHRESGVWRETKDDARVTRARVSRWDNNTAFFFDCESPDAPEHWIHDSGI